ncbi:MAG: bifunctional glutamate N-acetyltransferase/amino-acid acetyltransferase ArgJ [Actinobacteria bacterium]|nr:bifunctional glutamate N-acetyltransferase/amino-acid acetyltransferase ArgJ [Actinomycetota bacterium]
MQAMGFERILGGVCAPEGFLASGVSCGIKEEGGLDLALVYSEKPAAATGVFTTNSMKSPAVVLSRERLLGGAARAVVVNSGNANSMTGARGVDDAAAMAAAVEDALEIPAGQALVASTGRIGEYLPIKRVVSGIRAAVEDLNPGGNTDATKAIMTTDTYPKELAAKMEIGGKVVRVGAMAKGSGMIHPNLATMISVITTDLDIGVDTMRDWLGKAVEWSFNRISVDGDMSTCDTVFMMANGAVFPGGYKMTEEEAGLFFKTLCWLTGNLAVALVKDGEGATKLLRVVVNGAGDDTEAVLVARAIGNSSLVKCAFHGGLPAWGRIAAAVGSAGVPVSAEKLSVAIGESEVFSGGEMVEFDPGELGLVVNRDEVEITVDLGQGSGSAYFMTCDLSPEYVEFNAGDKSLWRDPVER